jgi:hypothetical protein
LVAAVPGENCPDTPLPTEPPLATVGPVASSDFATDADAVGELLFDKKVPPTS